MTRNPYAQVAGNEWTTVGCRIHVDVHVHGQLILPIPADRFCNHPIGFAVFDMLRTAE